VDAAGGLPGADFTENHQYHIRRTALVTGGEKYQGRNEQEEKSDYGKHPEIKHYGSFL
jgi:hypothetical protein